MLIRQQLVVGDARRVNAGTNPCTSITVHETGNTSAGADAGAHANLQSRGNSRSASWHWTVDDSEAVQSYLHTARCWHAAKPAGNNTSIGVEICVNSDGNQMQAYRNAAELVRQIMTQENLPINAVVQHNHWSGKNCPERLRGGKFGLDWSGFLALVQDTQQTTVTTPAPTPAPSPAAQAQTSAPTTYAALAVDGVWGPVTTTALQVLMREIGRYSGAIDGQFGPLIIRAVQEWLTGLGHYTGAVDGVWGPLSRTALQRFLRTKSLYGGRLDGVAGPLTIKALQGYLNAQRAYL